MMPTTTKRRIRKSTERVDSSDADRLAEYRAKRRFGLTPEPAPGAREESSQPPASKEKKTALAGSPVFVVQKHDARRLHYDVRLELDGAMVSWAVPKGPRYDPAVRPPPGPTDDHPLEHN